MSTRDYLKEMLRIKKHLIAGSLGAGCNTLQLEWADIKNAVVVAPVILHAYVTIQYPNLECVTPIWVLKHREFSAKAVCIMHFNPVAGGRLASGIRNLINSSEECSIRHTLDTFASPGIIIKELEE